MSECLDEDSYCTCTSIAESNVIICECNDGYISGDDRCYSKNCYDQLTDTFCGNLNLATCDNKAQQCKCDGTSLNLIPFQGRCITSNCLTGESSKQAECWNRGYCQINIAGGACRCYSAYVNGTGCTKCNLETSLEKTTSTGVECIPKICMDKQNPSVNLVCNNMGTCTPFINSESTMLYICKCNENAFSIGDSCYPKECVITDPLVSNSLTVCNSKGSCDFTKHRCVCTAPYTGRFCRSCLSEYIAQYTTTENGFLFLCIHQNCWDPALNTHCSGHGNCTMNTESNIYQCSCEQGYILKENTYNVCASDTVRRRSQQGYFLLSDVTIIVLLAIAILGISIYLLMKVVSEKRAKRRYKLYVHQEKVAIARSLHTNVSSAKQTSAQSSVLSTAEHIAFQRRYV